MDNITLGIVIPVFGSTRSVAELVHQIHTVFTPVCTYHIYLVDDGNPENVYTLYEFIGEEAEFESPYGKPLQAYGECLEKISESIEKLTEELNSFTE